LSKGDFLGLFRGFFLLLSYGSQMARPAPLLDFWHSRDEPDLTPLADLWDSRDRFVPEQLSEIPEAAQRYLEHAIAPGTVLASSVRLQMHGEIKLRSWHQFTAEQLIQSSHDFLWRAHTYVNGILVEGFDELVDGKASTRWKALGVLPMTSSSGPKVTRSSLGRAVAESVWLPSTLCSKKIIWKALTPQRPHAHLPARGEWSELGLRIRENGELRSLNLLRLCKGADGVYRYLPFGALVEEEDTFHGYTIPSRLRIGYHVGTDRFEESEFLRITVDDATFA
jgi:hypothetical protein